MRSDQYLARHCCLVREVMTKVSNEPRPCGKRIGLASLRLSSLRMSQPPRARPGPRRVAHRLEQRRPAVADVIDFYHIHHPAVVRARRREQRSDCLPCRTHVPPRTDGSAHEAMGAGARNGRRVATEEDAPHSIGNAPRPLESSWRAARPARRCPRCTANALAPSTEAHRESRCARRRHRRRRRRRAQFEQCGRGPRHQPLTLRPSPSRRFQHGRGCRAAGNEWEGHISGHPLRKQMKEAQRHGCKLGQWDQSVPSRVCGVPWAQGTKHGRVVATVRMPYRL